MDSAKHFYELDPFSQLAVKTAASSGFGYVGRLATAPYTSNAQKTHDVGTWFLVYSDNLQEIAGDMAKNGKSDVKFEFKGFVNLRLSEDDKGQILEAKRNVEIMMQDCGALIYNGYKLSFNYDRYSGAQQVTLTCTAPDDPNYGYAISARHPDLDTALATLLYKHYELANAIWSSVSDRTVDRNWD